MLEELLSSAKKLLGEGIKSNTQKFSGSKFSDVVGNQTFPQLATVSSWVVTFPDLYNVDSNGRKTTIGMVCKYPQLVVQSDISLDSIESKGVKRKNKLIQIPTSLNASSFSLTVNEDQNYSMTKYFNFWRNLVVDEDGYFGVENIFRYNLYVKVLKKVVANPSKPETSLTWKIEGAYPTDEISYTYSRNAELLSVQVKFNHKGITPQF